MSKINMSEFIENIIASPCKKGAPILSFPAVSKLGITVKELISSSDLQAKAMKYVADSTDSLFSVSLMDLSVEAECFGAQAVFTDSEVPAIKGAIISSEEDADALKVPAVGTARSGLYIESLQKAVKLITDRPIFAGVIGPFSLAGRLMDVTETMVYCYDEPDMVHTVVSKATEFLIEYIKAYRDAGANGVVIAEPLAGLLSPALCEEFSSEYVKRIVDSVQTDEFAVVYHNCGNFTIQSIDNILATGAKMYHFGNAIEMKDMMQHIPANIIAMGNVDPSGQFKNGTPESMKAEVNRELEACSVYPNYVISSGCDIPPLASWDNINAFFEATNSFYAR